jgi:AhpD family alkylhydroperoxidase
MPMTEPRIPPRPRADWDAQVFDALSVLAPPGSARPARDDAAGPPRDQAKDKDAPRPKRELPNILGTLVQHPALAKAFLTFNNHLFACTLPGRDRELVTVRVTWLRRGEYEWAQHVQLARAAGVTEAEIEAISAGPDDKTWGTRDAALLRATDEIVTDRYICDATWKQLAEYLDRRQLMDLVFLAGAYDLMAMAMNTFGLQLDPGLAGFPE